MTERLYAVDEDGLQHYLGLSSDTKTTSGVPVGSKWLETDTGECHTYNGTSWAPISRAVVDGNLTPLGYAQYTSLSAAIALTDNPATGVAKPATARVALIQCETQNVRWRDDGTAPTAALGILLATTVSGYWYTGDLSAIKFIEVTGSAKLNVSYYK